MLIGGGTATYVAVSDKNSGAGASSPQAAIKSIVDDLDKSDLIGVLNDLAPGERDALVNPFQDEVKQVKRLNVLEQNADPSKITGLTVSAANLTYESGTEKINDHVEIVKLTGGTIAINSDATRVPFTHDFLQTAFPNGLGNQTNGKTTLDIGQAVKQKGSPIRLAAQKVGGKWYPSIFYTFADAAAQNAGLGKPTASDYIPPAGAPSAEDAVKLALNAGLEGDLRQVIALTSPDELGALHDYGGLLLGKAGTPNLPDATIKDLSLTTQKITNGVHVSLSNITVDPGNGNEVKVAVVGKCVQVSAQGDEHKFCASDVMGQLNDTGVLPALDPAQKTAIQDLLSGVVNVGIDTAQSGGKWYINPVRSSLDLTNSLLSGLQGNDVIVLVKLIRSFAGH